MPHAHLRGAFIDRALPSRSADAASEAASCRVSAVLDCASHSFLHRTEGGYRLPASRPMPRLSAAQHDFSPKAAGRRTQPG